MMSMRSGFRGLVHRKKKPGEPSAPSKRNRFMDILLGLFGVSLLLYWLVTRS